MCGIVGFINHKKEEKVLENMMNRIRHRGPDGKGMYLDDMVALGHRRLSIVDIDGGRQPMENEDGSLILIFNGEIYNYKELQMELEKSGHTFRTQSDTEVLVHGYEEWNCKLVEKLRGMFAFVIWDKKNKELFCARDHFGIKPFYYYRKNGVFLFASEIKCFLEHPDFEKVLNRRQLELYLSYQYSPGNDTFFEHVYKLPPAHYLIWKNEKIELKRYWEPLFMENEDRDQNEWENVIERALKDSVKVHKNADVEVGSFLSSGMDSSLIAAISDVQKTFTVGFSDEDYDESKYAKKFSEQRHLWNQVTQISAEEFWAKLPMIQYYMDEPLADASSAALYFLNREAAKHVKVVLSGEGADEIFAGYHIYKEPYICERYDRIPLPLRRAAGGVAECFPAVKGRNFLVRHARNLSDRYIGNTTIFTEKEKRRICKNYRGEVTAVQLSAPFFKKLIHADAVTRMQYTDLHLWLVGDILLKADKMSMANGLELRVPFLDKEVFDAAKGLPTKYRVNKKETKYLLRRVAAKQIGEENAYREKLGFPVPVRKWLREEQYASMVAECFRTKAAEQFFDTKELMRLLREHMSGKRDNWRQIWCIYTFLIWYDVFFGED